MGNKTIRRHELSEFALIYPRGKWECVICLQPKIWLEVLNLGLDDSDDMSGVVTLVCAVCKRQLKRALDEAENLRAEITR